MSRLTYILSFTTFQLLFTHFYSSFEHSSDHLCLSLCTLRGLDATLDYLPLKDERTEAGAEKHLGVSQHLPETHITLGNCSCGSALANARRTLDIITHQHIHAA